MRAECNSWIADMQVIVCNFPDWYFLPNHSTWWHHKTYVKSRWYYVTSQFHEQDHTFKGHASHIHELNLEKLAGKLKSEEHIQVIHQQPHFGSFYTIVYGKSTSTIITGTSWWAWWRLKSPTSRLFTQLVCSGTDPCLALDSLVVPFWRPLDGLRNFLLG